jgi:hypothetical protein
MIDEPIDLSAEPETEPAEGEAMGLTAQRTALSPAAACKDESRS